MILFGIFICHVFAKAPKVSSWKMVPDVVVCSDSKVNLENVKIAVRFWEQKGHTFGNISYKGDCKNVDKGFIKFIGDSNLETGYFGMTEIFEYGKGHKTITSAYIEISDIHVNNLVLLAHELGHAIGYIHSTSTSDIMYKDVKKISIKIERK